MKNSARMVMVGLLFIAASATLQAKQNSKQNSPSQDQNSGEIQEIKDKIADAIEACYDLFEQYKSIDLRRMRDQQQNLPEGHLAMSDVKIQERVNDSTKSRFNNLHRQILNINQKFAVDLVNGSQSPARAIDFITT